MGEKKLPEFLNFEQFRAEIRDWSLDTLKRRVKSEGFPAFKEGNEWVIPRAKAMLWFEKRQPRNRG